MPGQSQLPNAVTVLGVIVVALAPVIVLASLLSQIVWYHGLGLFYAALGGAEVAYLGLLLALQRHRSTAPLRVRP